jgi:hypothetical protein
MDKETKGAIIAIAPVLLIIWLVVGYVVGYLLAALIIICVCIFLAALNWWIDFVLNHFI